MICAAISSSCFWASGGLPMKSSFIFVLIKPGQIVFTRIPSFTWSNARHLVNCITAPFEVQYATVFGQPINPATEELLMIDPPPFFIMWGITCLHIIFFGHISWECDNFSVPFCLLYNFIKFFFFSSGDP